MEVQSLPHVEPENVFPATAKKSLERIPFRNGFEPLEKLYFPDGFSENRWYFSTKTAWINSNFVQNFDAIKHPSLVGCFYKAISLY